MGAGETVNVQSGRSGMGHSKHRQVSRGAHRKGRVSNKHGVDITPLGVVYASEAEGVVWCHRRTRDDKLRIDRATGRLCHYTKRGEVRIVLDIDTPTA